MLAAMLTKGLARANMGALTTDDFGTDDHRRIWGAIQSLAAQNAALDYITVNAEMERLYGKSDAALNELLDASSRYGFTKGYGLKEYITIVREHSRRRTCYEALMTAAQKLSDSTEDTDTVLTGVRQALTAAENGRRCADSMEMSDVLSAAYGELENRAKGESKGIPYGITALDRHTAGLHKGELTLIGARPAVGKSALGVQIAIAAAQSGAKVLICSREMTAEQYGIRVLMRGAGVDSGKLRAGDIDDEAWDKLAQSLMFYGGLPIRFAFTARYVEDLRQVAEQQLATNGLDVLVVDYTQLMQTRAKFEKDYMRIGYVSKALKDMTVDLNIAVVALAQVGRAADGDMPTLAELRGSGDLEQDADNVIFMHRPASANDKWVNKDHREAFNGIQMQHEQYIVLNIAKQRQGETASTAVVFSPRMMEFKSITQRSESG